MAELVCRALTIIVSDNHRTHVEPTVHELIAQTQHIFVVSNAKVSTHLFLLDVFSANHNHNLKTVTQLLEHAQLAVRLKAWKHTRSMVVVKQLAAQLQIQLAIKLSNALTDVLRLNLEVFLVVKSYFHTISFNKFGCKGKKI